MDNDPGKKLLVVLPTYNEKENIVRITEAVLSIGLPASILIVDDNSPDGTGPLADELARKHSNVFVIHRPSKLGLGSAYVAGFKFGIEKGFDYICEMDADFSHDPNYLKDIYIGIQDHDLVNGSRYLNGISIVHWPMHRLLMSYIGNTYVKLVTGMSFTDCTGGFKCFRADVLRSIGLDNVTSKGYIFQTEMLYRTYRKGFRITEVPIIFYNRKYGKSKMDKSEIVESLLRVVYLRCTVPSARRS